jgi:hypothetical protein
VEAYAAEISTRLPIKNAIKRSQGEQASALATALMKQHRLAEACVVLTKTIEGALTEGRVEEAGLWPGSLSLLDQLLAACELALAFDERLEAEYKRLVVSIERYFIRTMLD